MKRTRRERRRGSFSFPGGPAAPLLLLFFALAFWARWRYALRTTAYTYDSYYYLTLGRNIMHHFTYSMRGVPHAKFLPLYPGTIAFTSLFLRDVELAGKLVNAGCFSLAVFPVYGIGRRCFETAAAGLLAAFLLALEPLTVAWGSLPMSEGLYVLLICLAAYLLVRWWQGEGDGWLWGAAAAGGLCAVTRWEGLLMMAVLGLPVLARGRRLGLDWKKAALAAAIFLFPFALWCLRNLVVLGHPLRTAYGGEIKGHPPEWEALGAWMRFKRYLLFSDFAPIKYTTQMYNYGLLVTGYAGYLAMAASRRLRGLLTLFLPWIFLLGPFHFLWYFTSARFLAGAAPALCLGAGLTLSLPLLLARRIDARPVVKVALALLCLITACAVGAGSFPVARDIQEHYVLGLEGPVAALAVRDASLWAKDNLPGDALVVSDAGPAVSFYLGRDALFLGEWQLFDPADIDPPEAVPQMRSRGVGYMIIFAYTPYLEDAFREAGMPDEYRADFEELAVFHRNTAYSPDRPDSWVWVLGLRD
jgi:hypothetical protein